MTTTTPPKNGSGPLRPRVEHGATFKIIGLGGVGGIVARYLTTFLASLDAACRLVLIDGDEFEEKNATREKIAFGRLRHLRSTLQRRFAEVDAFDAHVEKIRR